MDNNFVFDTTKFVLGEVKKRGFKNCNGGACRALSIKVCKFF